jgi:class 3 adenylate cyclase
MTQLEKHANTVIAFVDVSGSTRLYVDRGDEPARILIAEILRKWSVLTTDWNGRVIQLRGDGMLCMFPTVDAALHAVVSMRDLPYEPPLSMHAGIHSGPVLHEDEQLYGDVVNVAARMADVAKKFEIVLTAVAHRQLTDAARWRTLRLIPQVPIKGKPEPMDVYLLANDLRGLTDYKPPPPKRVTTKLRLTYQGQAFVVSVEAGSCLIGRDDDCRIKIDHRLVSRRHASVDCAAGKFFLQDHSTNGTYVVEGGGAPVLVHRELLQLKDSGVISLGAEPETNPGQAIAFWLER